MTTTRFLPNDDGRVSTRIDGFIVQSVDDDDAPIVVPSAIAKVFQHMTGEKAGKARATVHLTGGSPNFKGIGDEFRRRF